MRYYLAIDIGASSGRHIISYLENGKMQTEEIYRFQNGPEMKTAYDGREHWTWDPDRLFQEILNGLKKAGELGKVPYNERKIMTRMNNDAPKPTWFGISY
ncbi:MAG: hypothetical protein IKA88_00135 [Clostridia bacterium]|nr:hypothetical protein [Clostridia bacterium]